MYKIEASKTPTIFHIIILIYKKFWFLKLNSEKVLTEF